MCHAVVFSAPLTKFYTTGPPTAPPTDDGVGSISGNGLGSTYYSISGSGSGKVYDGANFVDDEDFAYRRKRGKLPIKSSEPVPNYSEPAETLSTYYVSGTSAKQKKGHNFAADSPIDLDSSPPTSSWDLAGRTFQSLLWQVSAEERRFDDQLKEARESRDREKELGVEQKEAVKQEGKVREAEYDVLRQESDKSGQILPLGEREDEWIEEEFVYLPEDKVDGTHSEAEWNENLRKILLESGLGIEWNKDTGLDKGMGDEQYRDYEDAPMIMGLKLLPVDTLEMKPTELPNIHSD